MKSPIVQPSAQRDNILEQQAVVVPPGGSAFMVLSGSGLPIERDTDGFAALALGLIGALAGPFQVIVHQYYLPGAFVGEYSRNSVADPSGAFQVVNITRPITNKYIAVEIVDLSGVGTIVIASAKLRPISAYDAEVDVVFDPTDALPTRNVLGDTVIHFNGAVGAGPASTPMFGASTARLEVVGVNIGPSPIHVSFGVPAVFGSGQYIRAGGDFRFDRTSLDINFIDDGVGTVRSVVSATDFRTP
jgi:hypothetical protein